MADDWKNKVVTGEGLQYFKEKIEAEITEAEGVKQVTVNGTSVVTGSTAAITVATGSSNGTIAVQGSDVAVKGLKSAAYTESSAYATAAQGALADTAVQSITLAGKAFTVASGAASLSADDLKAGLGLKSAAYAETTAFDAAGAATSALTSAKAYTDDEIKKLDVDSITVGAANTIAAISETDGKISVTTAAIAITSAQVSGLGSAAGQSSGAFATAAQGALAESAVQAVSLTSGTNNGTVKLTVDDTVVDNIAVTGLKSAAFVDTTAFDAAGAATSAASAALTSAKAYTDEEIQNLDVDSISVGAANTITAISETDGKISVTTTAISIASAQVNDSVATITSSSALAQSGAVKTYVDTAIAALPEPMVFKGSLGTGGTITELPTASAENEGWTYKVITAGTYAGQAADIGDTFICAKKSASEYEWVLIPSGDEPSGTVTSVGVSSGNDALAVSNSPVTSSGVITITHATSAAGAVASDLYNITTDAYGHVTAATAAVYADLPITGDDLRGTLGVVTTGEIEAWF